MMLKSLFNASTVPWYVIAAIILAEGTFGYIRSQGIEVRVERNEHDIRALNALAKIKPFETPE